jgi:anti-sigma-K factor RskA
MSDLGDISGRDEDEFLVAEYALGLLTPAEYDALGNRLRHEPVLRADLNFWRSRLASLDGEFAEVTAPAGVWPALERRLFADRTAAARTGFWNSLNLWRGFSAAAALVAIVAIGVNVATPRPDANAFAAQVVAALSAQGSSVSVVALYNADTGKLRLTALSGESVPDKDYELWAIEGSNAPKSMGVITVSGSKDMTLTPDELKGFGAGTTLAISLEPKGGSPTGQPTGAIVAAGKATQI